VACFFMMVIGCLSRTKLLGSSPNVFHRFMFLEVIGSGPSRRPGKLKSCRQHRRPVFQSLIWTLYWENPENLLACDHVTAGIRADPLGDPDLIITSCFTEGEMNRIPRHRLPRCQRSLTHQHSFRQCCISLRQQAGRQPAVAFGIMFLELIPTNTLN